jgi:membrane protease YdiL (CAAX protease family)
MPYILLGCCVVAALCLRNKQLLYTLIAITNLMALYNKVITLTALLLFTTLAGAIYLIYELKAPNKIIKYTALVASLSLSAGFVLHELPGFFTYIAIDHITISAATRKYSMYLNFDKVMAALIIYIFSNLIKTEKAIDLKALKQTMLVYLACVLTILVPAFASSYIKPDPKIPNILAIWLINNFLFVCFSEEVIFRGFLQTQIKKLFPTGTKFVILTIALTSIIFGLAHYKDGTTFMALAAICGLFYSYTYYKTGRVLCAMLVHFFLNLTHILIFTYP